MNPAPRVAWLLPTLSAAALFACNKPKLDQDGDGFTELTGDCDDLDANVHPDAPEVCENGIDDNCNGIEDEEGATSGRVWYIDLDGDGYGSDEYTQMACNQPDGFAAEKWDCQEDNAEINPGAPEVCDAVDNDCDGEVDEGSAVDATTWYPDRDGDGFGSDAEAYRSCEPPLDGYIAEGGDCDDRDPARSPGAQELCETDIDEDCNGETNDLDAFGCTDYYADADGDGFAGTAACYCEPLEPFVFLEADDCDDTRDDVHPGAPTTSAFRPEDCGTGGRIQLPAPDHVLVVDGIELSQTTVVDMDADGEVDLLLGSWSPAGPSRVVFGPLLEWTPDDGRTTRLPSSYSSGDGETVAVAPDLDGDGVAELLVRREVGDSPAIQVFPGLVSGSLTQDDVLVEWAVDTDPGLSFQQSSRLFHGDPDADGVPDLILFAGDTNDGAVLWHPLQAPVSSEPAWVSLELWEETQGSHQAYNSLDASADVNGDGLNDLIVGVPLGDPFERMDTSEGRRSVNGAVAVYLAPVQPGDRPAVVYFGYSGEVGEEVAGIDVDRDGYADVITGDPRLGLDSPSGGGLYGWLQPQSWTMQSTDWPDVYDADFVYTGDTDDKLVGVKALTDVDGDGVAEWHAFGQNGAHHLIQQRPSTGQHSVRDLGQRLPDAEDTELPTRNYQGLPDLDGRGAGALLAISPNDSESVTLSIFGGEP